MAYLLEETSLAFTCVAPGRTWLLIELGWLACCRWLGRRLGDSPRARSFVALSPSSFKALGTSAALFASFGTLEGGKSADGGSLELLGLVGSPSSPAEVISVVADGGSFCGLPMLILLDSHSHFVVATYFLLLLD